MKICTKCKIEKNENEFHKNKCKKEGLKSWCKNCDKQYRQEHKEQKSEYDKQYRQEHMGQKDEYNKQYRQEHEEQISEYGKQYRQEHMEQIKEQKKQYYQKHKKQKKQYRIKNRKKMNIYCFERRKNDPCFRLRCYVSKSIRCMLKSQYSCKDNSILNYLPYTIQQLKDHIESQFDPWMNWNNHGVCKENELTWHIDHIIPQSKLLYDSMSHPNFLECWSLENLRPLEAIRNIQKGNKLCQI